MTNVTSIPSAREQAELLVAGCDHVETRAELEERIASKGRLTVKFGIDPTGPFVHLGHAVVLHKMQQFVAFGHRVILLIGDFTARIGDPTGRNDTRPPLTDQEIAAEYARRIASRPARSSTSEHSGRHAYNSTWLAPLSARRPHRPHEARRRSRRCSRATTSPIRSRGRCIPIASARVPLPDHAGIRQRGDAVADVELGGSDQLLQLPP
jgi:tyrosyl-tRNA synthetase